MTATPAPAVEIVEHDDRWPDLFGVEATTIRNAIAPARCLIDHIGSTAVKGLAGKPVIDILVTMASARDAADAVAKLTRHGFHEGDRVPGAAPARYLCRRDDGGRTGVNVHVVQPSSALGERMVAFRDALAADGGLAARYAALKRELAKRHTGDLDAYTAGKTGFVERVLAEAAGAFGLDQLLTHQRAELDRSQALQILVITVQFALALLAALSVFSNDNGTLLSFALGGFAIAGAWLWLGRLQRERRASGDLARRVVLVGSGLGHLPSAEQRLRVFGTFRVPIAGLRLVREESYFASRAAPGPQRLAEMIEESAFWTADLQRASAAFLRAFLVIGVVGTAVCVWLTLPDLPSETRISLARVLVAFLVFLLSSDVIGAALAHRDAANTIEAILGRVEAAASRGHPEGDVLLLMADYNSAVESAPVALPFMMALRRRRLGRRWREYKQTKASSRT